MPSTPLIIPAKRRVRRKRRAVGSTQTPPAALTLVWAFLLTEGPRISLQFDRAIDLDGRDGSQIIVDGGDATSHVYMATGPATVVDPMTVEITLVVTGPSPGLQMLLTATAATGIVAADDGGTWAGVTDLELPFNA